MMTRIPAAILALAGVVSLGACGAGDSEFVTRASAACVALEGQQAAAKCACQTRIVETALTEKEKTFVLATMTASTMDPGIAMKALTDAGMSIEDMKPMGERMAALQGRMDAECPA